MIRDHASEKTPLVWAPSENGQSGYGDTHQPKEEVEDDQDDGNDKRDGDWDVRRKLRQFGSSNLMLKDGCHAFYISESTLSISYRFRW
jgi:hypothetical protein